jgi:hypothetical protein
MMFIAYFVNWPTSSKLITGGTQTQGYDTIELTLRIERKIKKERRDTQKETGQEETQMEGAKDDRTKIKSMTGRRDLHLEVGYEPVWRPGIIHIHKY